MLDLFRCFLLFLEKFYEIDHFNSKGDNIDDVPSVSNDLDQAHYGYLIDMALRVCIFTLINKFNLYS